MGSSEKAQRNRRKPKRLAVEDDDVLSDAASVSSDAVRDIASELSVPTIRKLFKHTPPNELRNIADMIEESAIEDMQDGVRVQSDEFFKDIEYRVLVLRTMARYAEDNMSVVSEGEDGNYKGLNQTNITDYDG
jgi:hypothetical protein